jgi:hypothetical protein
MYRAQRIAEFALYDSDPRLIDSELDHYLNVTAADIKRARRASSSVEPRRAGHSVPAPQREAEEATAARRNLREIRINRFAGATDSRSTSPEPESPVHARCSQLKPTLSRNNQRSGGRTAENGIRTTAPVNMSQPETFRSQAPAPLPPHPIYIPAARETVLANGLTIVVGRRSSSAACQLSLAFRVGGAFDPPGCRV